MRQIMWWTYGLSGKECKKIFPELPSDIDSYSKITYVRRNEIGRYSYRFTDDDDTEENEREDFEGKLRYWGAEEQFIEGLVGVI
jgi:hypothetical protein